MDAFQLGFATAIAPLMKSAMDKRANMQPFGPAGVKPSVAGTSATPYKMPPGVAAGGSPNIGGLASNGPNAGVGGSGNPSAVSPSGATGNVASGSSTPSQPAAQKVAVEIGGAVGGAAKRVAPVIERLMHHLGRAAGGTTEYLLGPEARKAITPAGGARQLGAGILGLGGGIALGNHLAKPSDYDMATGNAGTGSYAMGGDASMYPGTW